MHLLMLSVKFQVTVVNHVNSAVGPSNLVDKEYILYGKGYITEQLRGLVFEISANSFFQTNTNQVPLECVLYFRVIRTVMPS